MVDQRNDFVPVSQETAKKVIGLFLSPVGFEPGQRVPQSHQGVPGKLAKPEGQHASQKQTGLPADGGIVHLIGGYAGLLEAVLYGLVGKAVVDLAVKLFFSGKSFLFGRCHRDSIPQEARGRLMTG